MKNFKINVINGQDLKHFSSQVICGYEEIFIKPAKERYGIKKNIFICILVRVIFFTKITN
jgi:hypothetical protein